MKETIKTILIFLLVILAIAGLFRLDFIVWRAGHPTAPTWVYFLRSK